MRLGKGLVKLFEDVAIVSEHLRKMNEMLSHAFRLLDMFPNELRSAETTIPPMTRKSSLVLFSFANTSTSAPKQSINASAVSLLTARGHSTTNARCEDSYSFLLFSPSRTSEPESARRETMIGPNGVRFSKGRSQDLYTLMLS